MGETPDYYAALGLTPAATPEEIKHAYRLRAKTVHPDAGGSPEAMELVNEAYRTLSDASLRRDYDQLRTRPVTPADDNPTVRSSYIAETDHLRGILHQRQRRSQARSSAWQIIKSSALLSLFINLMIRFFAAYTSSHSQKLALVLVGFLPIYGLLVGFVFLISPDTRLALHDLFDPRTRNSFIPRHDLAALVAIVIAFVPVAALWILVFGAR
jgi:hypothetical protein